MSPRCPACPAPAASQCLAHAQANPNVCRYVAAARPEWIAYIASGGTVAEGGAHGTAPRYRRGKPIVPLGTSQRGRR